MKYKMPEDTVIELEEELAELTKERDEMAAALRDAISFIEDALKRSPKFIATTRLGPRTVAQWRGELATFKTAAAGKGKTDVG